MKRIVGSAMLAALMCAAPAAATPIITLIPSDGIGSAAPGETVGWGYEIVNDDPNDWLVITGLNTPDGFQFGTGSDALFTFPIVTAATSLTTPYLAGTSGLYEFTWDAAAPDGFVNIGNFVINAELWNGDPLAGGQFAMSLPDFAIPYSVAATSSTGPAPVPEPASIVLLSSGIGAAALARKRAGRRQA